jgi:hypothetical protein
VNIAEEIDTLKICSSIKENLKRTLPNFSQSPQQKILKKLISLINSKEKESHRKNIQGLEFINELSVAGHFINQEKLHLEYEKGIGGLTPDFVDDNAKVIIECFTVNLDNKTDKKIHNTKPVDKSSVVNGNIDESIYCYSPNSPSLVQKMIDGICSKIKKYQNVNGYRLIIVPYASFTSSLELENLSPDTYHIYFSNSGLEGMDVTQGEDFQSVIKKILDDKKLRSSKLQIYFFDCNKKCNLIYNGI